MKYAIIAAVFVFALAQGSLAQDASPELAKATQMLEEMRNKMTELIPTDFAANAQDWINTSKTQLESQLETLGPQMQEQMKGLITTMEQQMKPLTEQFEPLMKNFQQQMEGIFTKMTEQAKALAN